MNTPSTKRTYRVSSMSLTASREIIELGVYQTYREALARASRAVKIGTGRFVVRIHFGSKMIAANYKDGRGFILSL